MLLTKKQINKQRKKERNCSITIPRPPIGGGVKMKCISLILMSTVATEWHFTESRRKHLVYNFYHLHLKQRFIHYSTTLTIWRTDFKRIFKERMNKHSFIDAVDDEEMKTWAKRSTGAHQVFNVTHWNINSYHAHEPSSNDITTVTTYTAYFLANDDDDDDYDDKKSTENESEMEPGLRVGDFGRVGSGHGSVCQTRCLTRFWVLTCAFIVALFLQFLGKLISAVSVSVRFPSQHYWFTYFS